MTKSDNYNKNGIILIAEDDDTNFYYLNVIISKEYCSKIIRARNGREAIDLFRTLAEIKVVLMDIKMPEVDGLEATRKIKSIRADIPVIAITAYVMPGDKDRVLASGCDAYISKPFSKEKLKKILSEYI